MTISAQWRQLPHNQVNKHDYVACIDSDQLTQSSVTLFSELAEENKSSSSISNQSEGESDNDYHSATDDGSDHHDYHHNNDHHDNDHQGNIDQQEIDYNNHQIQAPEEIQLDDHHQH